MRHCIFLSGLLGIYSSLRRLVVFLDILFLIPVHFMLDFIMPLVGVVCVNSSDYETNWCPYYACYD